MRRLDKEESRKRWQELRGLWNEWDPIGIADEENQDEYDTYVGETMRLLELGASKEDIVKRLSYIVGEYMGMGQKAVEYHNPSVFAQKLQTWYAENWPETKV